MTRDSTRYQQLLARSEADLAREGLVSAIDDFGLPAADLAGHLGVHLATAYRRLAVDRARRAA